MTLPPYDAAEDDEDVRSLSLGVTTDLQSNKA